MSRKKPSSSWYIPTGERRELWIARHLAGAMDLLRGYFEAAGVDLDDMGAEFRDALDAAIRRILADAFDEGAKHESGLRTAVHTQRVVQHQLEALLRAHGIAVPTARLGPPDSDPW